MTEKTTIADELKKLNACREAIEWAIGHDSWTAAWEACESGSWLAWYVGWQIKQQGDDIHRKLVWVAAQFAEVRTAAAAADGNAADADAYMGGKEILRRCAEIVREHFEIDDAGTVFLKKSI